MIEQLQTGLLVTLIILFALQSKKTTRSTKRQRVVLDSCALIDGRIVPLAQSGFLPSELVVPDFVVRELQMLADGADAHKRERARFGLDVVQELQALKNVQVVIDRSITDRAPTDDKLVRLAKHLHAPLYTTDYNLNKVAAIEDVLVMNVNELAQHLRPTAIPGDRKTIKLLQKGSNPNQAVGYLDDGTMVVVDNATKYIGKMVAIEVTRTHQTVAGKMMFATLAEPKGSERPRRSPALHALAASAEPARHKPRRTPRRIRPQE